MKTVQVNLPKESVNEVQRASIEVAARQGVIDRFFEKHINDEDPSSLDSKPFVHFMKLLAESEAELDLAKQEVFNNYVPEYLKDHQISWNLDYYTNILTINVMCDCDIPELD